MTNTVKTRGSAWLQKLAAHRHPDFAQRPKMWCKVVSRHQDLKIDQRSGHAWDVPFVDVDKVMFLEKGMFMMVARAHPEKLPHGKPVYDIKLIESDGDRAFVVPDDEIDRGVRLLYKTKHINAEQLSAAKNNHMYACALYCYSVLADATADIKRLSEEAEHSLKRLAQRKSRRRITRIAAIDEEIDEIDKDFQP